MIFVNSYSKILPFDNNESNVRFSIFDNRHCKDQDLYQVNDFVLTLFQVYLGTRLTASTIISIQVFGTTYSAFYFYPKVDLKDLVSK